jgi:anti-anti-sigma regulatory factor
MHLLFPKLFTVAYSKHILRLCYDARISQEEEVVFDLSKTEFISPFGITLLAGTIGECLRGRKKVLYTSPKHRRTKTFLTRIGFDKFFHLKEEITEITDANVQLRKLRNLDPTYTDRIISAFKYTIRMAEDVEGLLKLSLNETMANAFEFGISDKGCYVCAQVYRNTNVIRVCITDFGVGIYNSLIAVPEYAYLQNSFEAIILAAKEGVTSRLNRVGGRGLSTLIQFLNVNKGRMVILSGNGKVAWDFAKSREPKKQIMSVPFQGTIVSMRIRTDSPGVYIMRGDVIENVF